MSTWKERDAICMDTDDPDVLAAHASDKSVNVRITVARSKYTRAETLEMMSRDDNKDVRFAVATNRNTPENILVEMAEDPENAPIAYAFLYNENSPDKVIRILADSPYANVRLWVARSERATLEILDELSGDYEEAVRIAVATNKNTPPELLDQMVKDTENVQYAVVQNPNTAVKTLERFKGNKDRDLQVGLAKNENTPEDMLRGMLLTKKFKVRRALASNPSTPVDVLDSLSRDPELVVLMSQNPRVSEPALRELYKNAGDDFRILRGLAENPSTPLDILEKLAMCEYSFVQQAVAKNPSLSDETRLRLANQRGIMNELIGYYEITELRRIVR